MATSSNTPSLVAPQRDSTQDPHPAWLAQAAALSTRINGTRGEAHQDRLGAERDALIDRIIDTPASSNAGALTLARIVAEYFESECETEQARASRALVATLERLISLDPHPDAELFQAWTGFVEAARGLRACPDDSEEAHEPFHAAMDRHRQCLSRTPARTIAGLAVKLRLAFTNQEGEDRATYDFMLHGGPRPDDLLEYDDAALLWGSMEDAERLAREA